MRDEDKDKALIEYKMKIFDISYEAARKIVIGNIDRLN